MFTGLLDRGPARDSNGIVPRAGGVIDVSGPRVATLLTDRAIGVSIWHGPATPADIHRSRQHRVLVDDRLVVVRAQLWRALLGVEVHVEQPEAVAKSGVPLQVVL